MTSLYNFYNHKLLQNTNDPLLAWFWICRDA